MSKSRSEKDKAESMKVDRVNLTKILEPALKGDVEALKAALEKVVSKKNRSLGATADEYLDGHHRNALHFAAFNGQLETTKYLLSIGCNINTADDEGVTALIGAARFGSLDVTKLLLDAKADLHLKNQCGATALHFATQSGEVPVINVLLEHKADIDAPSQLGTPLQWSVAAGKADSCRVLLSLGASVEVAKDLPPLLPMAASFGAREVVALLLESGRVNINGADDQGCTALINAAEAGHHDIVKILLDAKADPDLLHHEGNTALDMAIAHNHDDCTKMLLAVTTREHRPFTKAPEQPKEAAKADDGPQFVEPTEEIKSQAEELKGKANEAFHKEEYEAAANGYSQALALWGGNAVYYSNRCSCYLKLNRLEEALKDAQMAVKLKPDWSKAKYREGEAYAALGEHAEAAGSFWEAMTLDKKNAEARLRFKEQVDLGKAKFSKK